MALGRLRTTDQATQRSQSHLLVLVSLSVPQMFTGPSSWACCESTVDLDMWCSAVGLSVWWCCWPACFLLLPALFLWALTSALCLEFMSSLCSWRLPPFVTPDLPSLAREVILCKPELPLSHVSPELPLKYLFLDQSAPFSEQSTSLLTRPQAD